MRQLLAKILFILIVFLNADIKAQTPSFSANNLNIAGLTNPTTLQFGPDGRLYVGRQDGTIHALTVQRNSPGNYQILANEVITIIKTIPNHNDNGTPNTSVLDRQVTGIALAGTAASPIIYVSSSDPRIGGGNGAVNKNLDTNSGVISRLTKNGNSWTKVDLVNGLPRSEENHAANDIFLDKANNILYVGQGGNTNMGSPSNNFVNLPEYAYSAAILSIDLNAIGNTPYNLPTLDDEDRAGVNDANDPFGGNNGKNQAMLVQGGSVQIYAPGFRNAYDVLITQAGKMYSWDNGPNQGWGGPPTSCNNSVKEPGIAECDHLHYISGPGYYGGHPNPTRANRSNTFNSSNPQSPIPNGMQNPDECTYIDPSDTPGEITSNCASTNGLAEYTASNFNNAMKGNILACGYNGKLLRIILNAAGTALASVPNAKSELAAGIGSKPLDVTAQGDNDIFPGTIWLAMYGDHTIVVLEPLDYIICTPNASNYSLDSDNDGYSDGDENDNGTDMCSPSSKPDDFDNDHTSNLNDPDDDNDSILDHNDAFALDANNGTTTTIPVIYAFDNSNDGGVEGWGFTGLMKNGSTNYKDQYNPLQMTVGGAARKFTVEQVSEGDALQAGNNQENGFQFGVNTGSYTGKFIVHTRVMGPFAGITPQNNQSLGMFIGTGDQDNYLKMVIAANGGAGGIHIVKEQAGGTTTTIHNVPVLGPGYVDLYLNVNKTANTVQPMYSKDGAAKINLGSPISINASWLSNVLAVGFISTSSGPGVPFAGTWDFIEVIPSEPPATGTWQYVTTNNLPTSRHECSFVKVGDKFCLAGGRSFRPVNEYDLSTNSWAAKLNPPIELHHFQAVEYNGLLYAICAFTGTFPNETPVPNIYIFNPATNTWQVGPTIPVNRRRGSAGVILYNNEFYIVNGIQNGHLSGWVPWVDKFNPTSNIWTTLADAPRSRDHFHATLVGNKIYAVGGRRTGQNGTFKATVPEVDIYDIGTNTWSTLPVASNVITQRAGASAVLLGNEILLIGGESEQPTAHNQTEALNLNTNTWRALSNLNQGRHGTQCIVQNNSVYIAAGSGNQGGSPELNSMEVLTLSTNSTAPIVSISSPANGATYNGLTTIKISAVAFDTDGTIQKVEFYSGSNKLGEETGVPYNFLWTNISPGNYVITAVATDNNNLTATSAPINITVSGGVNGVGVVSLTLINADTDQDIQILNDGDIINFQTIGTSNLNIRANTSPLVIGSVKFGFNANASYRTESGAPYSLAGDNSGNYSAWTPPLGDNTITATPYTGGGASGDAGTPHIVHFLVINQAGAPDCQGIPGGAAVTDDCGICSGGTTGLVPNSDKDCNGDCFGSAVLDCNGVCNGTATLNSCNVCVGGNTGLGPNAGKDCNGVCGGSAVLDCNNVCGGSAVLDCNGVCGGSAPTDCNGTCNGTATLNACNVCTGGNTGLGPNAGKDCNNVCNGTAAIDNCGQCAGGNTGIVPGSSCAPPCVQNEVISFTLMHSGTAGEIGPLTNGMVINLFSIGSFSIRANVCSTPVGSVKFIINGATFRAETVPPYALNSDSPTGNYIAWNPGVGSYTLVGRPYTGSNASGTAGIDETVTFTIVNQAVVNDCNGVPNGTAVVNSCNICVGGNTGLPANSGQDCNGVCGGSAFFNACNVCIGGNTGLGQDAGKDCAGTCGGTAVQDCNGACNGSAIVDCNGVCGGSANLNSCNICVGGNTGLGSNAGKDCNGVCGGSSVLDCNNVCGGSAVMDCNGICGGSTPTDCNGVCNGTATLNVCNVCTGGNTGLGPNAGKDCNNVCNGTAAIDNCGQCAGGNTGILPGSSCAPPCIQNEVVSFTLMREGTAGVIGPLTNGAIINLATIGNFSIRADVCSTPVGSVKFIVNGVTKRTETAPPYALNGDSPSGSYTSWNPAVGSYTLIGRPYTGSNATGTVGIDETVTFTVINQVIFNDCNGVLNGTAFLNSCNICVGGNTGLAANAGKDCNGTCGGTASLNSCSICVGGTTGLGPNAGKDCNGVCGGTAVLDCNAICGGSTPVDCNGVCNGTAFLNTCNVCIGGNTGLGVNAGKDCNGVCNGTAAIDNCGQCAGGNTGIVPGSSCAPACVQNEVVSFTLMYAGTAGPIVPLTNGMVINRAAIGPFSIRADVCSTPVGSVKFIMNGVLKRIETDPPYAYKGDSPIGSYTAWDASNGSYTLIGKPYTGANGTGTSGVEETVTFTVINSSSSKTDFSTGIEEIESDYFEVYPNPNSGTFLIRLNFSENKKTTVKLFNNLGQLIYDENITVFEGQFTKSVDISAHPVGVYLLQIQTNDLVLNKKVVVR